MKTYETKENPDGGMKEGNAPLSEISPRGNILNRNGEINYFFRRWVYFYSSKHSLSFCH